MHDKQRLEQALQEAKPTVKHGPFSRCVGYHHLVTGKQSPTGTPPQPLWGIGSKRFGGRFTPRNSFETIYLAEDPVTALAEVRGILVHAGTTITLLSHPWVTVTVQRNFALRT